MVSARFTISSSSQLVWARSQSTPSLPLASTGLPVNSSSQLAWARSQSTPSLPLASTCLPVSSSSQLAWARSPSTPSLPVGLRPVYQSAPHLNWLGLIPINPLLTIWPQFDLPVSSLSQLAWAHPSQPPPLLVGLNRFTSQLLSSVGLGQLHLHC